jgi:hypothetical protein
MRNIWGVQVGGPCFAKASEVTPHLDEVANSVVERHGDALKRQLLPFLAQLRHRLVRGPRGAEEAPGSDGRRGVVRVPSSVDRDAHSGER